MYVMKIRLNIKYFFSLLLNFLKAIQSTNLKPVHRPLFSHFKYQLGEPPSHRPLLLTCIAICSCMTLDWSAALFSPSTRLQIDLSRNQMSICKGQQHLPNFFPNHIFKITVINESQCLRVLFSKKVHFWVKKLQ